jgi:hypothetical protein
MRRRAPCPRCGPSSAHSIRKTCSTPAGWCDRDAGRQKGQPASRSHPVQADPLVCAVCGVCGPGPASTSSARTGGEGFDRLERGT